MFMQEDDVLTSCGSVIWGEELGACFGHLGLPSPLKGGGGVSPLLVPRELFRHITQTRASSYNQMFILSHDILDHC